MNTEQLEALLVETNHKLVETNHKVDLILSKLEGRTQKKPGLTMVAFAEAAGVCVKTVQRWYAEGKIRKQNGRIPYECLAKFLS